jgi:hypothetical protein
VEWVQITAQGRSTARSRSTARGRVSGADTRISRALVENSHGVINGLTQEEI